MDKIRLIEILRNISILLEIKGENRFKTIAYSNAADIIVSENLNIEKLVSENTLGNVKGFGKALQEKITDYVINGKMTFYENLTNEFPESLVELTEIKGFGPKKVYKLFTELQISSLKQLAKACDDGIIQSTKGFGNKDSDTIYKHFKKLKQNKGKILLSDAYSFALELQANAKENNFTGKIGFTGDLALWRDEIEDFSLVYNGNLTALPNIEIESDHEINYIKAPKQSICRIIEANEEDFYYKVHHNSCSENYRTSFYDYATSLGYQIDGGRLFKNGNKIIINDENDLYKELSLQFVPCELREFANTILIAAQGGIPELIEDKDLVSVLHCHSTWSDGKNSIEEMANEAMRLGYKIICITDHSRTAGYANGLSIERVLEQHKEIDSLNLIFNDKIKILKGIESDILNDGSLDYPDEILQLFDLIVASIHSNFDMDKATMTSRIIKAIENPYTTILGHPTGRLILQREGYEFDFDEILIAAKENNVALEINANPHRLDLSYQMAYKAMMNNVKLSINPDAHNLKGITHNFYGIKTARKSWLRKENVINTFTYNNLMNYLGKQK